MLDCHAGLMGKQTLLPSTRPLRQASALVLSVPDAAGLVFAGTLLDAAHVSRDDASGIVFLKEVGDLARGLVVGVAQGGIGHGLDALAFRVEFAPPFRPFDATGQFLLKAGDSCVAVMFDGSRVTSVDDQHVVGVVGLDGDGHRIGDGSAFPDPDAVLPEAVRREPVPGDLIRLHKTDDPILTDIVRYEAPLDDGSDGWRTDGGPYLRDEWTLDGVVEE